VTVYNPVYEPVQQTDEQTTHTDPVPAPSETLSAAAQKFQSCRWRRPAENGTPECCGHRDVLPITGAHGFDAEAWCPDCEFYKLRRTPKKRDYLADRY
jgi:hypothetical protein